MFVAAVCTLDFSLLRNLKCIVYFNAKIANCAFQLGMAKQ